MIEPGRGRGLLLVEQLVRRRLPILAVAVLLAAFAAGPASRLSFDQSIESMYAEDDRHLEAFRTSRDLFGGDEFVVVAYRDPTLLDIETHRLDPDAGEALTEFADRLSAVPGVKSASTQHLADAMRFGLARRVPAIRRKIVEMVEGVLIGSDGETTAIVLRLQTEVPGEPGVMPRAETFRRIRDLAAGHDPPAHVVGEPLQVQDMFRYVEQDGGTLFWWSLGLLAVVLWVLFRSRRWIVLPLAVVLVAIVWTEVLLVASGMRLSMVSSMLNSLVTIIGVATVTHVAVQYGHQRRSLSPSAALVRTLVVLAPPVFWAGATTAIGFAALLSSTITPVRSFGVMMALGTAMVLAAATCLLPGGTLLLARDDSDVIRRDDDGFLVRGLGSLADRVVRFPGVVVAGAVAVVLAATLGLTWLRVETDFSENFRADSDIRVALDFVESRLGGAGNWEVNFAAPEKLTEEYLARVAVLAERLEELAGQPESKLPDGRRRLTKVVSLTGGLKLVPKLPFVTNTLEKRLKYLDRFEPEFRSSLHNPELRRMRIVLRGLEKQQAGDKRQLIGRVEQLAREVFPSEVPGERPAEATGLFVLLTYLMESLLRDQAVSFVLAAVGITSMMTLAFGSLRIGLVALVPNLFPIVVVIGVMGWLGLPINIATAMIASVSLGLTVDSSIHYIAGFRRARAGGLDVDAALAATHQGVGRAVVYANAALIVGFSVLTLSHFVPLIYFGILVSVAMAGGVAGNLVLLPVLLRWIERPAAR